MIALVCTAMAELGRVVRYVVGSWRRTTRLAVLIMTVSAALTLPQLLGQW